MSIRVRSAGDVTLTGGDLSVDVVHTEDSISLGDGTNLMVLQDVGGVKSVPVKEASSTDGTQRTKLTDGVDNVEVDDIGGEKALKVSVIASIGGGAAPAETDGSPFTAGSSVFTPIGGVVDETSPSTVAEDETGMIRMTPERAMHVYIAGQVAGGGGLTDTELRASAVPVSLASVPLPTGAATSAKQDTMIGHLDGVEGLLGTIDTDTGNISTKIDTIAGAVSGSEMQVDIVTSALPSGAATAAHQVTQNGYLDGIETLIGTTNTSLTTIAGHVDGLEGLLTTIDADTGNLAGMLTSLQLIDDGVGEAGSATPAKGLMAMGTDGTNARTLKTDAQGELQVDISSSALPTGAATSAKQDTQITSLGTIAGAVSGTEMQVDVITLPAIPTGSNVIGKISVVDAAGNSCMDEGNDSLKVTIVAGAGSGGTSIVDDAAFTAGTTTITPVGGVYQSTPDSVNDNDAGALRMTANRVLMTELQNASVAVTGTFWQATQPVSGTVAVTGVATAANQTTVIGHLDGVETLLGTIDTDTGNISTKIDTIAGAVSGTEMQVDVVTSALPSGAATSAKQDTVIGHLDGVEALLTTIDGDTSNLAAMLTSLQTLDNAISGNEMQVDVLTMPTVAVTGTFWQATQPVSGTVTATGVAGVAAHDAAVSGNPVRVAGRAMLANGTAVAEDDTVDMACDNQGRQITTLHVPRDLTTQGSATLTTTGETSIIAAGGAGVFHDLTKIILTNSSSTATRVQVRDASGGTVRMEVALAANGGAVIDFGAVPMCATTANLAWYATLSGAVTSVYVYYQAIKRIA